MQLYDFQTKYLTALPPRFIFSADTGTGKTFMALAHYEKTAYPNPLLIVAPASKISTGDWEEAVKVWFEGRQIPEVQYYSYEKFSRNPKASEYLKHGKDAIWREYIKTHPGGNYAVIADECHKMANSQSGMGKAMFFVTRPARFFVGLSATPIPNGWISVANYFKVFGLTNNITAFKKKYVNIATYKGYPEIVGYFHEDELQRLWNGMAKPLRKEEALDLPEVMHVPVKLEAGPIYAKVYKTRIFEDNFLDNPSAVCHALRQSVLEPKITWLNDFLEGNSGHVVIFYNYNRELKAMQEMIAKHHKDRKAYVQNGDSHDVPTKGHWNEIPERSITLAQYQSGSTGIEMTYADTTIYLSPTYSFVNYEQSIGRTHRNGQTKKCTFYMLSAPGTIETAIWAALKSKRDFDKQVWYLANYGEIS